MSDGFTVSLKGVDELKRALADASVKIRTKAVRSALRKAGQVVSKAAKTAAPVLSAPVRNRKAGTVKRNIVVRGSKFARQDGNEGVYISVRALRGARQKKLGKAGAKNPNDPFYWWFLEFGTRNMKARPFLKPAAISSGERAIKTFMDNVVPQINALNDKAR